MISWTAFFSGGKFLPYNALVVMWTYRICTFGLRLGLMSISITHLVSEKMTVWV